MLFAPEQGNGHEGDDEAEDDDAGGFEDDADNSTSGGDGIVVTVTDAGDRGEGPPNAVFEGFEFGVGVERLFDRNDNNAERNGEEEKDGEEDIEAAAFESVFHS